MLNLIASNMMRLQKVDEQTASFNLMPDNSLIFQYPVFWHLSSAPAKLTFGRCV